MEKRNINQRNVKEIKHYSSVIKIFDCDQDEELVDAFFDGRAFAAAAIHLKNPSAKYTMWEFNIYAKKEDNPDTQWLSCIEKNLQYISARQCKITLKAQTDNALIVTLDANNNSQYKSEAIISCVDSCVYVAYEKDVAYEKHDVSELIYRQNLYNKIKSTFFDLLCISLTKSEIIDEEDSPNRSITFRYIGSTLVKDDNQTEQKLPKVLSTPQAIALLDKLRAEGLLDGSYMPANNISIAQKGIIAAQVADKLGIKYLWKTFGDFWGVERETMRTAFNNTISAKPDSNYNDFKDKIKNILKD